MKWILCFLICASNTCLVQIFRLNESTRMHKLEVFIMPGINPRGEKLMQFNFVRFKNFNKAIHTNTITLLTENGLSVSLSNPFKDTSYQNDQHTKSWGASFVLSKEEVAILKSNKLTFIKILDGNKTRKMKFPNSVSAEMYNLFVSRY